MLNKDDLNKLGLSDFVEGQLNEEGQICGIPPEEVRNILKKFSTSVVINIGANPEDTPQITAEQIAPEDLEVLNRYAASLAGVEECKVRAVYGCYSCQMRRCRHDHICPYGIKAETDCGTQCWFCCWD